MAEAFIVDAIRTPTGRRRGALSEVHPIDLTAFILKSLVARHPIPSEEYDDVVFGIVEPVGPQADCIARSGWLAAGLSQSVPAVTVDRQCGSSQQAVHFAAQAVMSGVMDVVIAGGVQSMSMVPMGAAPDAGKAFGFADPFSGSVGWTARYGRSEISQFSGAEMIAKQYGFSRRDMEEFSLESHARALKAIDEGRFAREIVPLEGLSVDETPRHTSLEKMASLAPVMGSESITAGVSSQTGDAASALLVVSASALKRYGLTPRARLHHMSAYGDDPITMLAAPMPATKRALAKIGLQVRDIDLAEVNEAFASVPMAWMKYLGFPHERLNVNGGAIALGHPLGATGVKLITTLLHELERTGGRYGLQAMCEGGGQANITIIERI